MISIVVFHIYTQTDAGKLEPQDGMSYFFFVFLGYGGRLVCNCFVMIGAWFLCDLDFKPQRVVNLWMQVFFYSAGITLVCFGFRVPEANIVTLVQAFLPIMGRPVWFAAEYLCMLLLAPFVNLLFQCSEIICSKLMVILGGLIIFCATMFPIEHTTPAFSELTWFLFLYMFIAYFKKYPRVWMKKKYVCFWGALSTYFICIIFYVLLMKLGFVGLASYYLTHYENLFSFAISVFVFFFFKNIKIADNRMINIIGESTFAVYVIHQTPCFYPTLWNGIFSVNEYVGKSYFMWYIFLVIITIFIVSITVESIRKVCFRRFVYTAHIYIKICCKIGEFYKGLVKDGFKASGS